MEWRERLDQYVLQINQALLDYTSDGNGENQHVMEAMQYSLFAGGKRLRPVLTLAAANMLQGDEMKAMPYACALEMIHTYSLIHDDLPAMDNDDFRRGKPTNHMVYGDGIAILAGDGLLNRAYEIMVQDVLKQDDPMPGIRAMNDIATAAGVEGMIGGQTADLLNEGKPVSKETMAYIHRHKTGALLAASLTAGAWIAGGTGEEVNRLREAGFSLGLAFQIQDDLLDLEGDEKETGKPAGSDARNEKATYPALYGNDASRATMRSLTRDAIDVFESFRGHSGFLTSLSCFLMTRRS